MDNTIKKLGKYRIIPVESINHSRDAMSLSNTLCEGGLPVVEITLRTETAIDAIRVMAKSGDVLVGAGTVLTIDQVRKAVDLGLDVLKFIPTGGIHPGNIVDYLKFPNVLACVGSWIAKSDSISAHRFDEILENTKEAVMLVRNV